MPTTSKSKFKIAVACEDDRGLDATVSAHFGRAPYYTVVEVEGGKIAGYAVAPNPQANSHTPGAVPQFIRSLAPSVVLAGGMGARAVAMLNSFGIDVATGASGRTRDVLQAYLAGSLSGIVACEHDAEGHDGPCVHHASGGPQPAGETGPSKESPTGKRVAIPVGAGDDLSAPVDPRFGRAARFLIVDVDSEEVVRRIDNTAANAAHGAGIAAAKLVADAGADAVLAGRFGPKAHDALEGLGVARWGAPDGVTAAEALRRLKAGELEPQ